MAETISANQRAQLFAMSTRQNIHQINKQTAITTPASLSFELPKTRLLAGALIRVAGKVKVKHATKTTISKDMFSIYRSIRRISLDLNNGFAPYVLSGEECAMLNMIDLHPEILEPQATDPTGYAYAPEFKASTTGEDNDFAFTLNLCSGTNYRDPIGLILLQNNSTNCEIKVDLGTGAEMLPETGYTVDLHDVTVKLQLETFSIPANANAYPDLSCLLLRNGRKDSMPSEGQQLINLSTGSIYRKLIFRLLDENNQPMDLADITSNIELIFNGADINYAIDPEMLRVYNQRQLGYALPKGMFVFDFSNGGALVNYGGTRDMIDTSNLTMFQLRFTTTKKGKCEIVTEGIARLTTN